MIYVLIFEEISEKVIILRINFCIDVGISFILSGRFELLTVTPKVTSIPLAHRNDFYFGFSFIDLYFHKAFRFGFHFT